MRIFFAHGGGEAFARWREEQGQTAAGLGDLGRASPRSTAPTGTPGPRSCAGPTAPALAALRRAARRRRRASTPGCSGRWTCSSTAATGGHDGDPGPAVGFAGGGADAWAWQDVLGAGLPRRRAAGRVQLPGPGLGLAAARSRGGCATPTTSRSSSRSAPRSAGAGGLRIDHVMGLFRLWWVPARAVGPADGAYVRYPAEDLLDIVALESSPGAGLVVGEDLGTVEDGVREALAEHGHPLLPAALVRGRRPRRRGRPRRWPRSPRTTCPTVAGLWTGADVAEQREQRHRHRRGARRGAGRRCSATCPALADGASAEEAVERAHELLAGRRRSLLSATLDDAVGDGRPARTCRAPPTRPNWSLPLHRTLEEIETDPLVLAVAAGPRRRRSARAKVGTDRSAGGAVRRRAARLPHCPSEASPRRSRGIDSVDLPSPP